jgi:hypothetical protein
MKPVDYSPKAVTRRLKLASELREVCLSLKKAGQQLRAQEVQKPSVDKPS